MLRILILCQFFALDVVSGFPCGIKHGIGYFSRYLRHSSLVTTQAYRITLNYSKVVDVSMLLVIIDCVSFLHAHKLNPPSANATNRN